jgi:hypothetical protein
VKTPLTLLISSLLPLELPCSSVPLPNSGVAPTEEGEGCSGGGESGGESGGDVGAGGVSGGAGGADGGKGGSK